MGKRQSAWCRNPAALAWFVVSAIACRPFCTPLAREHQQGGCSCACLPCLRFYALSCQRSPAEPPGCGDTAGPLAWIAGALECGAESGTPIAEASASQRTCSRAVGDLSEGSQRFVHQGADALQQKRGQARPRHRGSNCGAGQGLRGHPAVRTAWGRASRRPDGSSRGRSFLGSYAEWLGERGCGCHESCTPSCSGGTTDSRFYGHATIDPGNAGASVFFWGDPSLGCISTGRWRFAGPDCPSGPCCPGGLACGWIRLALYFNGSLRDAGRSSQPRESGYADFSGTPRTARYGSCTGSHYCGSTTTGYQGCNYGSYHCGSSTLAFGRQAGREESPCQVPGHATFPWWRGYSTWQCRWFCSGRGGSVGPGDGWRRRQRWPSIAWAGPYGMRQSETCGLQGFCEHAGPLCSLGILKATRFPLQPSHALLLPGEVPSLCLGLEVSDVLLNERGIAPLGMYRDFVQTLPAPLYEAPLVSLRFFGSSSQPRCSGQDCAYWVCTACLGSSSSSSALRPAHHFGDDRTGAPPCVHSWSFRPLSMLPPFGFRGRLTLLVWLQALGAAMLGLFLAGAHNTCIGCSGTRALPSSLADSFSCWQELLTTGGIAISMAWHLAWSTGCELARRFDASGASLSVVVPDFDAVPPHWKRLLGGHASNLAWHWPLRCVWFAFCVSLAVLLVCSTTSFMQSLADGTLNHIIELCGNDFDDSGLCWPALVALAAHACEDCLACTSPSAVCRRWIGDLCLQRWAHFFSLFWTTGLVCFFRQTTPQTSCLWLSHEFLFAYDWPIATVLADCGILAGFCFSACALRYQWAFADCSSRAAVDSFDALCPASRLSS